MIFIGCSTNRYRSSTTSNRQITEPPLPSADEKPKLAPEVPEGLRATKSVSTKKKTKAAAPTPRIRHLKLFDKYVINGRGKNGGVHLDVSYSELFESITVSGYVGGNSIYLDGKYSSLFSSTSITGSCGDLGTANLEIKYSSLFGRAELSGDIGGNYVDLAISGVTEKTHFAYTATLLLAALFDA